MQGRGLHEPRLPVVARCCQLLLGASSLPLCLVQTGSIFSLLIDGREFGLVCLQMFLRSFLPCSFHLLFHLLFIFRFGELSESAFKCTARASRSPRSPLPRTRTIDSLLNAQLTTNRSWHGWSLAFKGSHDARRLLLHTHETNCSQLGPELHVITTGRGANSDAYAYTR